MGQNRFSFGMMGVGIEVEQHPFDGAGNGIGSLDLLGTVH